MLLPEIYDPILETARAAMQRAAAARGLTRPSALPEEVVDACCGEAIAAFNQGLLFRDGAAVPPYRDDPAGRALVRAYLLGYGPADEYLRHPNLEDFFIQGHA